MVRNRHDSFSSFRRPFAPFLQPTSDSFGTFDGRDIERSFLAASRRLRRDLLRLTDGVASNSISVQRFINSSRAVIRRAYFVTYALGAISVFPFYTLTDRDIRILDEELSQETGFLRQFGKDLASNAVALDPIQRSRLYLLALRGIFERGRLEAMPPGPYRWRLGNTEHCLECQRAAFEGPYQRERTSGLGLPVLPGAPGDGSVCLGLTRCGCRIELASGIPMPNEELANRMRGLLLEVAHGSSRPASRTTTE